MDYREEIKEIVDSYKYNVIIKFARISNNNGDAEFRTMADAGRVYIEIYIPSDSNTKSPSRMLRLERWYTEKLGSQNGFKYKFGYVNFTSHIRDFWNHVKSLGFNNGIIGEEFEQKLYVTKEELEILINDLLKWKKPTTVKNFKDFYKE